MVWLHGHNTPLYSVPALWAISRINPPSSGSTSIYSESTTDQVQMPPTADQSEQNANRQPNHIELTENANGCSTSTATNEQNYIRSNFIDNTEHSLLHLDHHTTSTPPPDGTIHLLTIHNDAIITTEPLILIENQQPIINIDPLIQERITRQQEFKNFWRENTIRSIIDHGYFNPFYLRNWQIYPPNNTEQEAQVYFFNADTE